MRQAKAVLKTSRSCRPTTIAVLSGPIAAPKQMKPIIEATDMSEALRVMEEELDRVYGTNTMVAILNRSRGQIVKMQAANELH